MPSFGFKFSDYLLRTDYKLHSPKILGATLVTITLIFGALAISELAIDLKGTNPEIIIPFFAANLVLTVLFYLGYNENYIGHLQIFNIYLVIETNFFLIPQSFHILLYWFPFIHIVVTLILGMQHSQKWFILTIFTIIVDGLYVRFFVGGSYQTVISYDAFISIGVIFSLGLYSTVALLYRLMGEAYQKMKKNQEELIGKNEVISKLNQELSLVNMHLDEAVRERTKELQKQNNQLIEYAFINSHLLRAPLAKILGSSYLISADEVNKADPALVKTLLESTRELDQIIHKIDSLLHDGGSFDRKDIEKLIKELRK